jgi:hypothetical protein
VATRPVGLRVRVGGLARHPELFERSRIEEHLVHRALPHEDRARIGDGIEVAARERAVVGLVVAPDRQPLVCAAGVVELGVELAQPRQEGVSPAHRLRTPPRRRPLHRRHDLDRQDGGGQRGVDVGIDEARYEDLATEGGIELEGTICERRPHLSQGSDRDDATRCDGDGRRLRTIRVHGVDLAGLKDAEGGVRRWWPRRNPERCQARYAYDNA